MLIPFAWAGVDVDMVIFEGERLGTTVGGVERSEGEGVDTVVGFDIRVPPGEVDGALTVGVADGCADGIKTG